MCEILCPKRSAATPCVCAWVGGVHVRVCTCACARVFVCVYICACVQTKGTCPDRRFCRLLARPSSTTRTNTQPQKSPHAKQQQHTWRFTFHFAASAPFFSLCALAASASSCRRSDGNGVRSTCTPKEPRCAQCTKRTHAPVISCPWLSLALTWVRRHPSRARGHRTGSLQDQLNTTVTASHVLAPV